MYVCLCMKPRPWRPPPPPESPSSKPCVSADFFPEAQGHLEGAAKAVFEGIGLGEKNPSGVEGFGALHGLVF